MRYRIVNMSLNQAPPIEVFSMGRTVRMPSSQGYNVDLTLEVEDMNSDEFSSIESFEKALKNERRISEDAPSYEELLAKYHPEFLL